MVRITAKSEEEVWLHDLYSQIPTFECEEGCTNCCGATLWHRIECESISAWLRERGLKEREATSIDCPYIENGGCLIYPVRSIMCRLFGSVDVDRLRCPKGRGPDKPLSAARASSLLKAMFMRE